jgi:hypothetical protein
MTHSSEDELQRHLSHAFTPFSNSDVNGGDRDQRCIAEDAAKCPSNFQ